MEEPSAGDRDRSRSRSPQTQRDQESDMSSKPCSRFFLGGLGNKVVGIKEVSDYFSEIVSAEIIDVTIKHHKGMGYIEFDHTSQYEEAKLLGKHDIKGRTIECKRAKAREQKSKSQSPSPSEDKQEEGSKEQTTAAGNDEYDDKSGTNRFFIGGINSTLTQTNLVEYFRQFGSIVDVLLLFHKGFGYIEFTKLSEQQISKIIGTHNIRGRSLEVKKAKPKVPHSNAPLSPQPPPPPVHQSVFDHHGRDNHAMYNEAHSPRYFLGGVTEHIVHLDLKEYFSKYGELVDVTIIPNKSIGYIQFKNTSRNNEAEREDKLFHQKHHIKGQLINCSRANPKQNYTQDFNPMKHQQAGPRSNYPQPLKQTPYNVSHEAIDGTDMAADGGVVTPRRFFLGGVNANTTRGNLMEYFTKYGEVINLMIFEAKNYGYIEFKKTTQELDTQRESVLIGEVGRSLHTINGSTVTCKRAIPRTQPKMMSSPMSPAEAQSPPQQVVEEKPPQQDDSKLKMFVGGLGLLNEIQIREYFCQFGELDSVLLLRGFGFIGFKLVGIVDKVIEEAKVINGKTMHCISGKYVECKRTFDKVHKFKPKPQHLLPHQQNQPFPGQQGPTPPTWNSFNPEAAPFTPNSMQHNPSQPQQFPQQQQQQQQQQQPGGYFNPQQPQGQQPQGQQPQGQQGGMYPGGQMPGPQQGYYGGNYGGMMPPQQGYDMNNPQGVACPPQQGGYDMNNMGQMMGVPQQGYDWNNACVPQYVDYGGGYVAPQNYEWANSSLTYAGQVNYYQGQGIQFPDFITGETASSMNASEQGSTSLDNDNSTASTPTQDSQQTTSSNAGEERTGEISDNTSSMSVQSVLSKYATENTKPQTKSVQSVLSKYSALPSTVEGDYSSGEQRDEDTAYGSDTNTTQYRHNSNGGQTGEEEVEEWFEGDLE